MWLVHSCQPGCLPMRCTCTDQLSAYQSIEVSLCSTPSTLSAQDAAFPSYCQNILVLVSQASVSCRHASPAHQPTGDKAYRAGILARRERNTTIPEQTESPGDPGTALARLASFAWEWAWCLVVRTPSARLSLELHGNANRWGRRAVLSPACLVDCFGRECG